MRNQGGADDGEQLQQELQQLQQHGNSSLSSPSAPNMGATPNVANDSRVVLDMRVLMPPPPPPPAPAPAPDPDPAPRGDGAGVASVAGRVEERSSCVSNTESNFSRGDAVRHIKHYWQL
jgi:hypothetical protein